MPASYHWHSQPRASKNLATRLWGSGTTGRQVMRRPQCADLGKGRGRRKGAAGPYVAGAGGQHSIWHLGCRMGKTTPMLKPCCRSGVW